MNSADQMEKMDVSVEDVHTKYAQFDEALTQAIDNSQVFVMNVKQEAAKIMAEAEKKTEAMKLQVETWEEEQKRIACTHIFEPKIKLDVGGHIFATTTTTLTRFPDTMLGAMFSGRHALTKDEAGFYFIDRDGTHFRYILNFLRSPESFDSSCSSMAELMLEADYYGLKDLMFPTQQIVPAEPETAVNPCNSEHHDTPAQDNNELNA